MSSIHATVWKEEMERFLALCVCLFVWHSEWSFAYFQYHVLGFIHTFVAHLILKKQERKSFCFTLITNLWSTNTMLHEGHFSFRIHQYFPFWAQLLLDCFMLLWCIGGIVVLSLNMLGHLSTSCLSTRFSPVAEDDPQVLDRPKCLAALASLRHAKWFQVRLICCFKRNCHILSYNVV